MWELQLHAILFFYSILVFAFFFFFPSQTKIKFINQQDDHTKSTVKAINIRTHQDDMSS